MHFIQIIIDDGCFYFRVELSLKPGFLSVLVWVPPKANHKPRIWVQVTFLWGNPRRHGEGMQSKTGNGGMLMKWVYFRNVPLKGQGSWVHIHLFINASLSLRDKLSGVSSPPLDQAIPAHSREGSNHH